MTESFPRRNGLGYFRGVRGGPFCTTFPPTFHKNPFSKTSSACAAQIQEQTGVSLLSLLYSHRHPYLTMQNRDNELTSSSNDCDTYGTYGTSQANRRGQSTDGQENTHRGWGASQKRRLSIGVAPSDSEGSASPARGSKRQKSRIVRILGLPGFPLPDDGNRVFSRLPLATLKVSHDGRLGNNEADASSDDNVSPPMSGGDPAGDDTQMSNTEDTKDYSFSNFMKEETVDIHEDSEAGAEPSGRPGTPSVAIRTFSEWREGSSDDGLPSPYSTESSERDLDLSSPPSLQPDHAGEQDGTGSKVVQTAGNEGLMHLDGRSSFDTSGLNTHVTDMSL